MSEFENTSIGQAEFKKRRASFTGGSGKVPSPTSVTSPVHAVFSETRGVKPQQAVTQEVAQQTEPGVQRESVAGFEIEAAPMKSSRGFGRFFCCFCAQPKEPQQKSVSASLKS